MENKTVFIKTSKGEDEIKGKGSSLSGDLKRALFLVDDKSNFEEILKHAAPSLREALPDVFKKLVLGGYVRDKAKPFSQPQIVAPKIITPGSNGELDFTNLPPPPKQTDTHAKEAAAQARSELEAAVTAAKIKAQAEAEAKAAASAKLAEEIAAKNKIASEARAKQDALIKAQSEAKIKQEAEARAHAEQAAAEAKIQITAAAKARAEAEEARVKAEQETAKIRAELEAAKAKAEADAKAKALAETRAKQEAEALRLKAAEEAAKAKAEAEAKALAKQEAEALRLKAAQEAESKRQLEAARIKAELEAAARAKAEAEEARLKAEQETARIRAELEVARIRAEAEAKALAEQHAKQEAEHKAAKDKAEAKAEARMRAEQAAAQAKIQLEADRVKTELAAAARAKAEAEEARLKAEQETARAKVEAKTLAEERAKQEAEALRLKAEQEAAKTKTEAEAKALTKQRAKEQASKEAIRPAPVAATVSSTTAPEKRPRVYRKPFPLGKAIAGLFVLALLSIPVLPYVIPLDGYIAPIEQKLSTQFKQPVHVKTLRAALLPWPKLELLNITIGAGQEVKAGTAIVTFDFLLLLTEVKTIRSLELRDIVFEASMLDQELTWLQAIGGNQTFPVKQVTLQHAQLANSELPLPPFTGDISINAQGKVEQLVLKSEDAKIDVTLQPTQNTWQINLNVKKSTLPVLGNVLLDDFGAKGEILPAEINFSAIDGQAYGGFLQGNAKLSWKNGWQLQGKINARSVELNQLFPKFGVTGTLAGEGGFSYSANRLNRLAETQQLTGSFMVKKGVINGMDMVETARQGNRQNASTGRTHFDELSGNFQMNSHGPHFQQLKIKSGILNGSGSFDVNPGAQISGRLLVELKAQQGVSALALSGTLTAPILRY
jgi:hypothetical protein